MDNQRYAQRGVSAEKEDIHNAIKNLDKGLYPNAFCKIILSAKSSSTSSAATRSIATSCMQMAREQNPHWPTSIGKRRAT